MFISPAFAQGSRVRRRAADMLMSVAAVRADFRHHVFPDPASAAEAGEAASGDGQERAARRHGVTTGGLVGKVTKVVDDDQIEVEIADGVRVRQMRAMVSDVRAKGEPVKDEKRPAESWRRAAYVQRNGRDPCCISPVEGGGDSGHGVPRLPVRRAEFLPRATVQSWPKWAQRHIVLGLDLQGGSHILLEVDSAAVQRKSCRPARRRAPRAARARASAIPALRSAATGRGPHPRANHAAGAAEAARAVAAARGPAERAPASARSRSPRAAAGWSG